MPHPIQFVFWVYGDKTYAKLAVSIDDLHHRVYDLKHAIMKKLELRPDRVGHSFNSLDLWKVSLPYATLGPKTWLLLDAELTDNTRLHGPRQLSYYFPRGPKRHFLDIIVRLPTPILCWKYGSKPKLKACSKIKIDYREYDVHTLKRLVDKGVRSYNSIYKPQELQLYEVSIPLTRLSDELVDIELKDPISHKLIAWPKPGHLHVIVKCPASPYNKSSQYTAYCDAPPPRFTMPNTPESLSHVRSQMIKRKSSSLTKPYTHDSKSEFERLPVHILEDPAPYNMKWHHYIKNQTKRPIIDGCYTDANLSATLGPPVQLLHPAFGHFLDDIADETLPVPETILAKTFQFMQEACRTHNNKWGHNLALTDRLREILRFSFHLTVGYDGFVQPKAGTIALMECTTAFGNGPDPAIQVSFSMARKQCEESRVRKNTCCPTFLIALGGPWLIIMGGVMTEYAIFQHLTDYIWLGSKSISDESHYYRVARIMHALKRGMDRLTSYYDLHVSWDRKDEAKVSFEPSINAYLDHSGQLVKFKYISKMEPNPACITFLAETLAEDPRQIVVKFVERYCSDAHMLLAAANMAPALYYYGKVGVQDGDPSYSGLKMVITEYIERSTAYDGQALPGLIIDQIKRALQTLHANGYVYGDLRQANILVTKEKQVKLVNFEMTGLDGKDCYPLGISPLVKWPDGVEGLSMMKIEHDFDMLNKMLAEAVVDIEML